MATNEPRESDIAIPAAMITTAVAAARIEPLRFAKIHIARRVAVVGGFDLGRFVSVVAASGGIVRIRQSSRPTAAANVISKKPPALLRLMNGPNGWPPSGGNVQ